MSQHKRKKPQKRYKMKPGYIVVDVSSATGGLSYDRKHGKEKPINDGRGYEQPIKSVKRIDDEALYKEGTSIRNRAGYVLRQLCAYTALGWFCERNRINDVIRGIAELEAEAEAFNRKARKAGAQRRVRVGVVPLTMEMDNAAAARELAQTIRDLVGALSDALRSGDVSMVQSALLRCKNLDTLAVGMQARSIVYAIEAAKRERKALKRMIREDGLSPSAAGKKLDLSELSACVGMFTEMKLPKRTLRAA